MGEAGGGPGSEVNSISGATNDTVGSYGGVVGRWLNILFF